MSYTKRDADKRNKIQITGTTDVSDYSAKFVLLFIIIGKYIFGIRN